MLTIAPVVVLCSPSGARADETGSLERDIGRMIMVGFRGLDVRPDSPIVRQIRQGYVGGVILFDDPVPTGGDTSNVESPDQVKRLIDDLQSLTERRLLIAVDQEGGLIQRLSPEEGFDSFPSHEALGRRNDPSYTQNVASRLAGSLHELGFNVNFAPVVDLNVNPSNPVIGRLERSFGARPRVVTRMARSFVRGHRERNVLPVLKHFPGHGSSRKDSHKGFVDVTDVWTPQELIPYRRLLGQGLIPAVMTAHLFNEKWDANWPATLSPTVIRGILRERLNHDGVVFTDDLQMGAIRKEYDRRTVLKRTVRAGVDVLVFANNSVYEPRVARRAVGTIRELIKDGEIRRETVQESGERIRETLKELSASDG